MPGAICLRLWSITDFSGPAVVCVRVCLCARARSKARSLNLISRANSFWGNRINISLNNTNVIHFPNRAALNVPSASVHGGTAMFSGVLRMGSVPGDSPCQKLIWFAHACTHGHAAASFSLSVPVKTLQVAWRIEHRTSQRQMAERARPITRPVESRLSGCNEPRL